MSNSSMQVECRLSFHMQLFPGHRFLLARLKRLAPGNSDHNTVAMESYPPVRRRWSIHDVCDMKVVYGAHQAACYDTLNAMNRRT